MNATTKTTRTESSAVMLAIDLAKDVFELAFADAAGRIVERKRLRAGKQGRFQYLFHLLGVVGFVHGKWLINRFD